MDQIPGRNEVEQREGEKGRRMTEASKSVLFMKLRSVPFQFRPRCPELRASLLWALPSLRHPPQSTPYAERLAIYSPRCSAPRLFIV